MIATIAFVLLIASGVLQIVFLIMKGNRTDPASHFISLGASLLLFADIIARSVAIRFVAVTNTFESLVFYAGTIALLLFIYRLQKWIPFQRFIQFGATMIAIALLALASSPLVPSDVKPPIPALQSSWLVLHVACSFIGEAFFVISFIASVAFLVTKTEEKCLTFDRITYTCIAIGYPIFTAGALIFGSIWAQNAWGRYWSWDPKETWALVTWLVYTAYLHLRLIRKKNDVWPSILSVIGFAFTLFTFFGVNYLLPGLHSYG